MCVRWDNTFSNFFSVSNGTRQGNILSPYLFARYIRDLLCTLAKERVGCNIGSQFVNVLAYADNLVLVAPSWRGLPHLLRILVNESASIDMTCNTKKDCFMVFQPKRRDRIIAAAFPLLKINENDIQYVYEFRYLGHIINNRLTDDDDINREINMFTRTNVLLRRFSKCSVFVKITLFKSYCMSFYDSALWRSYLKGSFQKLRSCYNKCLKMFFGYSRSFSLTQVLLDLRVSSFDTIIVNNSVRFKQRWLSCDNKITQHLVTLNN